MIPEFQLDSENFENEPRITLDTPKGFNARLKPGLRFELKHLGLNLTFCVHDPILSEYIFLKPLKEAFFRSFNKVTQPLNKSDPHLIEMCKFLRVSMECLATYHTLHPEHALICEYIEPDNIPLSRFFRPIKSVDYRHTLLFLYGDINCSGFKLCYDPIIQSLVESLNTWCSSPILMPSNIKEKCQISTELLNKLEECSIDDSVEPIMEPSILKLNAAEEKALKYSEVASIMTKSIEKMGSTILESSTIADQKSPESMLVNNRVLYKTKLCQHYIRKGICDRGKNCHFAHGTNELRRTQDNPSYRVKMCKNPDICSYGKKCTFLHPSEYK